MSFLIGSKKSQASGTTVASGLSIQSSVYGQVLPLVYGTTRISDNLLWYGDFNAQQQSSGGGGGKGGITGGGGAKGGGGGQYTYSTSFQLGICEGPIYDIPLVYVDKNVTTPAQLGLNVFPGTYPQAAWSYLTVNHGFTPETDVIPASSPYVVTVQYTEGFENVGVTGGSIPILFTLVTGAPGLYQYQQTEFDLLTFNASQAGEGIQIYTSNGVINTVVGPDATLVTGGPTIFSIQGYQTNITYTQVSSSPGVYEYTVDANGNYTFNAANAGAQVNISYYATNQPSVRQDLGYNGIAHVDAAGYSLGDSPQLPNFNFVVSGVLSQSVLYEGNFLPDADPSLVLVDILTNPHYGVGFPPELIGDLSQMQNFSLAAGIVISPSYTSQTQTASMIDDIMTATNCAIVWSNGKLNVYSYGDQTLYDAFIQPVANEYPGVTYNPPAEPLFNLTDDDFMKNEGGAAAGVSSSNNDDPVILTRQRPADAFNSIKVEYLDDTNYYNPAIMEAKDQASIDQFGLRQDSVRQFHMFCNSNSAQVSAYLQLYRQKIRNQYSFTLDQRYILLDPMDIVTLTDSYLGLNQHWVRIIEITENDDYSLSFIAEDYLFGTGTPAEYSFEPQQGFNANYNETAPSPNLPPILFEPTAELAEELAVYMSISGPPNWGGCQVWISTNDVDYKIAGTITGSSRTGVLTQPLLSVTPMVPPPTVDVADTLSVDLSQSNGQLSSATQADALNLSTLCYVDGEYIAYQNATLTGSNQYNLTYLVRGAYDSVIGSHDQGSQFARLDSSIFKYPYTSNLIGSTIYIKFLSFNIYGGGLQGLDSVTPIAYTLQGTAFSSPLPDVTNLRTVYVGSLLQLDWDDVTDFRPVLYEIRQGPAWASAQVLGRVAQPPFSVPGDGTYWVAAYSNPYPGIQVYSPDPVDLTVTGSQLVSNVLVSYDESSLGWPGTITGNLSVTGGNLVSTPGGSGTYTLSGSTAFLTETDMLGATDFLGGANQIVDVGYVAACGVIMTTATSGVNVTDNFLAQTNFLGNTDLLDSAAGQYVSAVPQLALSQDGSTFGPWQNYSPGFYSARAFEGRLLLSSTNPQVEAIATDFVFTVDVPDRVDHYMNLSVGTGGYTITFQPDGAASAAPFNGGPNSSSLPLVQVTIMDTVAGDDFFLSSFTLSGLTITIKNGGSAVARTVSVVVQGY